MRRLVLLTTALLLGAWGCAKLVFVSDRDGHTQIYRMRDSGGSQANVSGNAQGEAFPDVASDGKSVVLVSEPGGRHRVVVRRLTPAGLATGETILADGTTRKTRPRWSCQRDAVVYADFLTDSQASLFVARLDAGGAPLGSPARVTQPGPGESDSGGHDFLEEGNKIVFSRRNPATDSFDLFALATDGSTPAQPVVITRELNETLPVVSRDGRLLAYREHFMITPGGVERIVIVRTGTWQTYRTLALAPPAAADSIDALGFSHDDRTLYVAAQAVGSTASSASGRREIFALRVDGTGGQRRLTDNAALDSQPDGIPRKPSTCLRCLAIREMPAGPPSAEVSRYGVVVEAAVLPSGMPSSVAVEDYSSPHDGITEVKVGWSETNAAPARYAAIVFPSDQFGSGPREVVITAFHYRSCRFDAYGPIGPVVASASHTAGQNTSQTLRLHASGISRIDVVGAEIGLQEICYR